VRLKKPGVSSCNHRQRDRLTCEPRLEALRRIETESHRSKEPTGSLPMTKNIPDSRANPEGIPQEGHGGSNMRGTQHQQGKDGNGAQKRQQEKKS